MRLLEDAATRAHPKAQYNLARRLLTGDGVGKNEHRARLLLMAAADAGERKAARTLRVLKKDKDPPSTLRRPSEGANDGAVVLSATLALEEGEGPRGAPQLPPGMSAGMSATGGQGTRRPSASAVARAKAAAERRRQSFGAAGPMIPDWLATAPLRQSLDRGQEEEDSEEEDEEEGALANHNTLDWQQTRRRSLWVDLRKSEAQDAANALPSFK